MKNKSKIFKNIIPSTDNLDAYSEVPYSGYELTRIIHDEYVLMKSKMDAKELRKYIKKVRNLHWATDKKLREIILHKAKNNLIAVEAINEFGLHED